MRVPRLFHCSPCAHLFQDPHSFLFKSRHENPPPCAQEEAHLSLCHRSKTSWTWVSPPYRLPFSNSLSQPFSLRTYDELSAAGIPCTIVLDSAVSYVMDKVDFVLVGSEAVVESGGLINAVGSNQIAIIAKAANIPFYALAERFVPSFSHDSSLPHPYLAPKATSSIDYFRYRSTIFRPIIPPSLHSPYRPLPQVPHQS